MWDSTRSCNDREWDSVGAGLRVAASAKTGKGNGIRGESEIELENSLCHLRL